MTVAQESTVMAVLQIARSRHRDDRHVHRERHDNVTRRGASSVVPYPQGSAGVRGRS